MIRATGFTDQGNRIENQDAYVIANLERGFFAAVADGVGGNSGGKVASSIAIEEFEAVSRSGGDLLTAAHSAHNKILEIGRSAAELNGLATTVSAVICTHSQLDGVSCGDSRVYLLRNNGLKQLSVDHSEYTKLLSEGKLTREEAVNYPRRNVLYSALGVNKPLVIDAFSIKLIDGDRVVIMTDGVHSILSKRRIRDLSIQNPLLDEFCDSIKKEIYLVGPSDNFTFVALQI